MNFIQQMNKYILYLSVVLNGILLMMIFGVVPFFLYLSVIINLGLIWFAYKTLDRVGDIEEDMILLTEKNETFLEELEKIHGLELYYGDENLQALIENSRILVNDFIDIQEKYFEVEVTDQEEEEQEEEVKIDQD